MRKVELSWVYIASIAISNMIVLMAFTVAASIIRVLPVSRSIAP